MQEQIQIMLRKFLKELEKSLENHFITSVFVTSLLFIYNGY